MKLNRAEKLENKLRKAEEELKIIRKELHASKQKNRDLEKSRERYKSKVKSHKEAVILLKERSEKKTLPICYLLEISRVINTKKVL